MERETAPNRWEDWRFQHRRGGARRGRVRQRAARPARRRPAPAHAAPGLRARALSRSGRGLPPQPQLRHAGVVRRVAHRRRRSVARLARDGEPVVHRGRPLARRAGARRQRAACARRWRPGCSATPTSTTCPSRRSGAARSRSSRPGERRDDAARAFSRAGRAARPAWARRPRRPSTGADARARAGTIRWTGRPRRRPPTRAPIGCAAAEIPAAGLGAGRGPVAPADDGRRRAADAGIRLRALRPARRRAGREERGAEEACSAIRTSTSWTGSTPTSTTTAGPIRSRRRCCAPMNQSASLRLFDDEIDDTGRCRPPGRRRLPMASRRPRWHSRPDSARPRACRAARPRRRRRTFP